MACLLAAAYRPSPRPVLYRTFAGFNFEMVVLLARKPFMTGEAGI